jgi:hypothetical protein
VLANGLWRNRYKNEIYNLYKEMELARNLRFRRLRMVGYVLMMKDESTGSIRRRKETGWRAQRKMCRRD